MLVEGSNSLESQELQAAFRFSFACFVLDNLLQIMYT